MKGDNWERKPRRVAILTHDFKCLDIFCNPNKQCQNILNTCVITGPEKNKNTSSPAPAFMNLITGVPESSQ